MGIIASGLYVAGWIAYALFSGHALGSLAPNELGDFLAGSCSPLAFLWLVLGFIQQGHELRNSAAALYLQGEELRNSVEQQRALVEVTRQQAEAELAALQEERAARKQAYFPRITVHNGGGFTAGDEAIRRVRITNIGAHCSDVKLEFQGEFEEYSRFYSTLGTGESHQIEFRFHKKKELQNFTLTMRYIATDGTMGVVVYLLRPRENLPAQAFDIEEVKGGSADLATEG